MLNKTINFLGKKYIYLVFNTEKTSEKVREIITQEKIYMNNTFARKYVRADIEYLIYSMFFSENIITSDIAHKRLVEKETANISDGFEHISPVEIYRNPIAPLYGDFFKIYDAIGHLDKSTYHNLAHDFQNSTKNFYFQSRLQLNSYVDFVVSNIKNIVDNKNYRHNTYYMIGDNEYSGEIILTDEQFYLLYNYKILDFYNSKQAKIKILSLDMAVINALVKLIETAHSYKPINLNINNGGLNSEQYKHALERFQILLEFECTDDISVTLQKLYDYMIYMGVPESYAFNVDTGLKNIYLKKECVAVNRIHLANVPLNYLKLLERSSCDKGNNRNVRRNSIP